MPGGIVRRVGVCAALLPIALLGAASASDFAPDVDSEKPLTFSIAAGGGALVLEVDNVDVTSLATWSSGSVSYVPTPALSVGVHEIRISRTIDDETSIVVEQRLTVRRKTGLTFDGDVHANYQSTIGLASDPGRSNSLDANSGDLAGSADVQYGSASLKTSVSANYSGARLHGASTRDFDLSDWTAAATVPVDEIVFGVAGGTHSSGIESLVVGPLSSRGLTLSAASADKAYAITSFARSTTAVTGSRDFFGFDAPQDRIAGAEIAVRLLDSLRLDSTAYTGERSLSRSSAADASGKGWSVALDNLSEDGKFHARAEYAQTRSDTDGAVGTTPSLDDRAYTLSADYQALTDTLADGRMMKLSLRGEYESIGSSFYTLARPTAAADQKQLLLGSNFLLGAFTADAEFRHTSDNVNRFPGLPTNELNSATANFAYQDSEKADLPGLNWTLGMAVLASSMTHLPKDFLPEERVDSRLASATLGVAGLAPDIGWSLTHTYSIFDDFTNRDRSYVDHVTQAALTFSLVPLRIQSGLVHSYRAGPEVSVRDLSPTISIDGKFFEDRVSLAASYSGRLAYRTSHDDSQTATANVSGVLVKPQGALPGLTVNLGYTYNSDNTPPAQGREFFFGSIQFSR